MKLIIIIPAFNEGKIIADVIKKIPKKFSGITNIKIVVVNDGSTDDTEEKSFKKKAIVLTHAINRGAGAATKTGFIFARKNNADFAITLDADGQHDPRDIQKILQPLLKKEADVVIGSRFLKRQKLPLDRMILNFGANVLTFLLFGVYSTDSQSGLRGFSKKAIEMIDFKSDRMEFSSEILLEAKRNKLAVKEIPSKAIYTDYSKVKGQKNINAFPIFGRFMVKLLR